MNEVFLQYGALGAIALLALLAVKVMYGNLQEAYKRELERADRLEQELRALNEAIRVEYTGTIGKASIALNDANRAVADALTALRRGER